MKPLKDRIENWVKPSYGAVSIQMTDGKIIIQMPAWNINGMVAGEPFDLIGEYEEIEPGIIIGIVRFDWKSHEKKTNANTGWFVVGSRFRFRGEIMSSGYGEIDFLDLPFRLGVVS